MIELVMQAIAVVLLLNGGAGLIRILRGPTAADRLVAVQLLATTGMAVLLLLADLMEEPAARVVALVLAMLASLAALVFVRRLWWRLAPEPSEEGGS